MVFLNLLSFAATLVKIGFSGGRDTGRLVDSQSPPAGRGIRDQLRERAWLNDRNRVRAKSSQANQVVVDLNFSNQLLTFYSIRFGEFRLSLQYALAPTL